MRRVSFFFRFLCVQPNNFAHLFFSLHLSSSFNGQHKHVSFISRFLISPLFIIPIFLYRYFFFFRSWCTSRILIIVYHFLASSIAQRIWIIGEKIYQVLNKWIHFVFTVFFYVFIFVHIKYQRCSTVVRLLGKCCVRQVAESFTA